MTYSLEEAAAYANQSLFLVLDTFGAPLRIKEWPSVDDDGRLSQSTYTGDDFVEIRYTCACRPAEIDFRLALSTVLWSFRNDIDCRLKMAGPRSAIHWRARPDIDVVPYQAVVKYHEDGPDIDHVIDKRCTLDKDFWIVKTYARGAFVTETMLNARKLYLRSIEPIRAEAAE